MYVYQLVEFTSSKRREQIKTNKNILFDVLSDFYGNKVERMFHDNGNSRGFISVFVNKNQILSIKDVVLNPCDEICIVSSISGG